MVRGRFGFVWFILPGNVADYAVTLIYPGLLTTAPAAILWYRGRRRPGAHQCAKCGYDRRGLAPDAAYPECGKPHSEPGEGMWAPCVVGPGRLGGWHFDEPAFNW